MRTEEAVVHPLVLPVLFLGFFLVGAVADVLLADLGHGRSGMAWIVAGTGMAACAIGTRVRARVHAAWYLAGACALTGISMWRAYGVVALACMAVLVVLYRYWPSVTSRAPLLVAAGVAVMAANLVFVGTVPLLDPTARYGSQTVPFAFGYGIAFLGSSLLLVRNIRLGLVSAAIVFAVLMPYGFRSYLLILGIALGIEAVMLGKAGARAIAVACTAGTLVILGMGYVTTVLLPQTWHLNAAELVLYRVGFTTHMFDNACTVAGWGGLLHGELWLYVATSPLVGGIVAGSGNITSTLMGPLVLDGGVLEVAVGMAFVGYALASLHRSARSARGAIPYYALTMAVAVISVEISPVPLVFIMLLYALAVSGSNEIGEQ